MTRKAVRLGGTVLACSIFLVPLVLMVLGSLRDPAVLEERTFELIPQELHLRNYQHVFRFVPLWTYMRNSIVVVVIAVPLTILIASWAGFAIARARGRTQRWLVGASLVGLMVPLSLLWVPRFALYKWLGILDTPLPLIAPAFMATTPFYVLLFALVYARIPGSLYEAAEVEGLSPFAVWRRVAFPLGRPAAFAVGVLAFVWHWSNLFDPLLYLSTESRFTLPLGVRGLSALEPRLYPLVLAGSIIVAAPAIVAFVGAQRAFFRRTLEV